MELRNNMLWAINIFVENKSVGQSVCVIKNIWLKLIFQQSIELYVPTIVQFYLRTVIVNQGLNKK